MKGKIESEYRDIAFDMCDILDEKKGIDVLAIDVSKQSSIADFFVLATANSTTHAKTLIKDLEDTLSKRDITCVRRDGVGNGSWLVLDFSDIIVHVFTPDLREYYHLEKLWSDGKNIYNLDDIQKLRSKSLKNASWVPESSDLEIEVEDKIKEADAPKSNPKAKVSAKKVSAEPAKTKLKTVKKAAKTTVKTRKPATKATRA